MQSWFSTCVSYAILSSHSDWFNFLPCSNLCPESLVSTDKRCHKFHIFAQDTNMQTEDFDNLQIPDLHCTQHLVVININVVISTGNIPIPQPAQVIPIIKECFTCSRGSDHQFMKKLMLDFILKSKMRNKMFTIKGGFSCCLSDKRQTESNRGGWWGEQNLWIVTIWVVN